MKLQYNPSTVDEERRSLFFRWNGIAKAAGDGCDDARVHDTRLLRKPCEGEFAGIPIEPEFL